MRESAGFETPATPWLDRLDAVRERLRALSDAKPIPGSLTSADPDSGERWDWGQVWAHVREFPDYWMNQIEAALAAPPDPPPSFGRVRTDPGRVSAIEAERRTPVPMLWSSIDAQLLRLRRELETFTAQEWELRVRHATLGILDMPGILERFLVGHLEEHATQLAALASTP